MDENARLILVDDDADFRMSVGDYLKVKGYIVTKYSDGDQLTDNLEKLAPDNLPDLVIMDTEMPGTRGDQVCAKLKKMYQDEISILGMSGRKEYEQIWLEAGADGFIDKSQLVPKLEEKIKEVLSKKEA